MPVAGRETNARGRLAAHVWQPRRPQGSSTQVAVRVLRSSACAICCWRPALLTPGCAHSSTEQSRAEEGCPSGWLVGLLAGQPQSSAVCFLSRDPASWLGVLTVPRWAACPGWIPPPALSRASESCADSPPHRRQWRGAETLQAGGQASRQAGMGEGDRGHGRQGWSTAAGRQG